MTDIVSVLRTWPAGERVNVNVMREAADEIERLEAKCVQVNRYIALLNDEISDNGKLRDEIERLTAALEEYGDHKYECTMKDTWQCSCGYTAMLRATAAQ